MKYLVIILALLIAMPTVQAGVCGMGAAGDSIEQAAGDGHDCCPDEPAESAEPEQPCGDGDHCSGCFTAASALPVTIPAFAHARPGADFVSPIPSIAPSHSAPPYRPPIS